MDSLLSNEETGPSLWAEVILPLAVPKNYTYGIPENLVNQAIPGCRVEVTFGRNKKYAGILKATTPEKPSFQTKNILQVIDDEPIVHAEQLKLWEWISQYYMCSEGEVMIAALPTHLKLTSEAILIFNENYGSDFTSLGDEEYLVAEALLIKTQLTLTEVQQITGISHVYPILKKLIDKQVCFIYESLSETYREKKENFVFLNPELTNDDSLNHLMGELEKAPKQLELLLSYLHYSKTEGEVIQSKLLKKSGASSAQLKALEKKNILFIEKRSIDRIPVLPKKSGLNFTLSPVQELAMNQINHFFSLNKPCLLHGITGSGKTLLYIKAIEAMLLSNKQSLYLLPEITLTSQIIRRLQLYFGGHVTVYHSKFNNHERVEIWNKIRSGETKIILGARSALFLPFKNLGLIIIDEEQDSSFKQQNPAPRYNARDAALYYASRLNAKVILGSATPSLESYYNATKGKFGLVQLPERFGGSTLPDMEIIDLKLMAASQKGKVMISPPLQSEMEKVLKNNKQVILFQNRRGYSPFLLCGTCGYIPQCKQCAVSLTLHKYSNKLHCHYCGASYTRLVECPACGSINWREKNFGTEKVEEELVEKFPDYRIARMDVDAVKGKNAHDTLVKMFEQKRIDILVGTQMVVKGLDFEDVALVGILDADGLLGFADFRVYERAFQLMEQVSGRAGRKEERGKVLIQAIKTGHPVLEWVQQHDFNKLFEHEIASRKQFFYPPFSRLIKITLKHKSKSTAEDAAENLASMLEKYFVHLVGPAAPVVNRIRNMYLMEILLKLHIDAQKLQDQKKVILHQINLLKSMAPYKSVHCIADVDPY